MKKKKTQTIQSAPETVKYICGSANKLFPHHCCFCLSHFI